MADGVEPAAMAGGDSRSTTTGPAVTVIDSVERAVVMDGESRPTTTRLPPVVDGSVLTVSAFSAYRRTVPRRLLR